MANRLAVTSRVTAITGFCDMQEPGNHGCLDCLRSGGHIVAPIG